MIFQKSKIGRQLKTKFDKLKKIFYNKPDAPVEVSVESAAASTVIYDCNGCNGNR